MYCPRCRTEYVEGITECADCHVRLVAVLPPEPDHSGEGYVQVLSTYNAADITIIRSILDGTDITYFFQGEGFNDVYPLIQPATLFVLRSQEKAVRELLKDVQMRFLGVSGLED